MDGTQFKERLEERINPLTVYHDYLKENRITIPNRLLIGGRNFWKKFGELTKGLLGIEIFLALVHNAISVREEGTLPNSIHHIFIFLYGIILLCSLILLGYEIVISLKNKYEAGTYGHHQFMSDMAAEKIVDEVTDLLNITLKDNVDIARTRNRIKKIAKDIGVLKHSTERGGKIAAEIVFTINFTLAILDERTVLITETLQRCDIKRYLKHLVKHPESKNAKDLIVKHFSGNVTLTRQGYKKFAEICEEIYQSYTECEKPVVELGEKLRTFSKQFARHNDALVDGKPGKKVSL